MATYDVTGGRIVLTIAYDGARGAGKSTNVRALADALDGTELREGGAEDPAAFDWAVLRAGSLQGVPVLARLVGPPASPGLEAWRRHVLASADAVVLVCEATPRGLLAARGAVPTLRSVLRERAVPVVTQANKSDLATALPHELVARALGFPTHLARAAAAASGRGVVDTFLAALHAAGRRLEATESEAAPIVPARSLRGPRSLATQLDAIPVGVDGAAETWLARVAATLAPGEAR